jgi:acetolactate synthase-1/2/3 large subunit
VAVAGDGGFLFTVSSLATAVQERIPAVAVVFNDGGYTSIRRYQNRLFGREIGTSLVNPDFVALARAFGATGIRAESPEALHDAVHAALAGDSPAVIEVPLDPATAYA